MRKLIHVLAGSALALGLAACTGDDSDDTGGTSVGTDTTTTVGTDSSTAGTDGTGGTTAGTGTGGSGGTTDGTGSGGTSAGSGSSGGGSGSTGGGADPDGEYPQWDENFMCPDGFNGPVTFNGEMSDTAVCSPECMGAGNTCPNAETGTAVAFCGYNPDSSATACTTDDDCTVDGESCATTGFCLLASSHCILVCNDGQNTYDCPDAMTCTDAGICEYPAG